ncbi:MAG: serine/threonine-protein phosphatase [Oscillospiraceae bacterium]|nr:serine/threonine-protein phosphatase [Oscillospiraceae bacterium]
MRIETYTCSEIGARETNEDYAASRQTFGRALFVVADGVGGSPAGDVASRGAVETLLATWKRSPQITVDAIATIFESTNETMREHSLHRKELCGMRTTVAALFYRFGVVVTAHVGDSRVYLFRKNHLRFCTQDHVAHGRLTRVFGSNDVYLPELSARMCVKKGDAFLLCTDGFWTNVTCEEIERALSESRTPQEWVERMLAVHGSVPTEHQDNYTVTAGFFK